MERSRSSGATTVIALGAAASGHGSILVRNVAGIREAVIASTRRRQWGALVLVDVGIARLA